jgi:hypothetical protein
VCWAKTYQRGCDELCSNLASFELNCGGSPEGEESLRLNKVGYSCGEAGFAKHCI